MAQAVRPLRVGMVGHAFMGAAHTQGWAGAARFFPLPLQVEAAGGGMIGKSKGTRTTARPVWERRCRWTYTHTHTHTCVHTAAGAARRRVI